MALEAAYLAGFNASGEGYNAECPFDYHKESPANNRIWRVDRDNYIKEALAQFDSFQEKPKTEPVRIMGFDCFCGRRMVVSAEQGVVPASQRKPLLASDIVTMYEESPNCDADMIEFARAIEAAHGIKD